MTQCAYCESKAQYQDRHSGRNVCLAHARLEVVAAEERAGLPPLAIRPSTAGDVARIVELALHFWDETIVDCFDREYDVAVCPAYVACEGDHVVGVASYALEPDWNAVVLVALQVLPEYQGRGGGRVLLNAVGDTAAGCGLEYVWVATTNDDLPALSFYQRYGFSILEVVLNQVADHHGGAFPGLANILIRDEIRLSYEVCPPEWGEQRKAGAHTRCRSEL